MATSEMDRLGQIFRNMSGTNQALNNFGNAMVYDRSQRTFRQASPHDTPDNVMKVTQADMGWGASCPPIYSLVVVSTELLEKAFVGEDGRAVSALCWDGGDTYHLVEETTNVHAVPAGIYVARHSDEMARTETLTDVVRVIIDATASSGKITLSDLIARTRAYVRTEGVWQEARVLSVPNRAHLFSRHAGLFDTDKLSTKRVFIPGVGSLGSGVALSLVQSGVAHIELMDHDRLEVGNLSRHVSPIAHVGRYKTHSVADVLRGKNPYCDVRTWEAKVTWDTIEEVRACVRNSDLVICGLDSHQARLIINQLCLEENVPCIFAGLRRRAYGGQVLIVRPGMGPCYECHVMMSPDSLVDREISNEAKSQGLAYTDKVVPVEPGLANDVAPIVTMTTKLAIQQLLHDQPTTLRSLDEDLIAPLYLFLNRREQDTPFAELPPMGFIVDDFTILRWYGLPLERNPACPHCGDLARRSTQTSDVSERPWADVPPVANGVACSESDASPAIAHAGVSDSLTQTVTGN